MEGIDNFNKVYPDFKGYIDSGYLLHLFGKPRYSNKTGKRLKWDEKITLAIPTELMDRVDQILKKFQIEYGHKVRPNMDYYINNGLFKRIKVFKKILK
jgi:hypothetical protein